MGKGNTGEKKQDPPLYRKFIQGGLAAMSGSAASHPLDVIKVRLQVQGEAGTTSNKSTNVTGTTATMATNAPVSGQSSKQRLGPVGMGGKIFREEGLRKGLFKGLSASLARQGVYSRYLSHY